MNADDGLAMPDLMVLDVVTAALEVLLTDTATLDFMLAGRPAADRDMMRTALQKRPGKVRLGLSGLPLEDWSVVNMMASQGVDGRGTLGNEVGGRERERATALLTTDVTMDAGAVLTVAGGVPAGIRLPQGCVRLSGDEVAIYKVSGSTITLPYRGVRGTEALPHATGSSAVFHDLERLVGSPMLSSVRVDVLSGNGLFTTYLAHMLAAFLLGQEAAFELAGMTLEPITQTDMAPRPQAYPAAFACRTLLASIHTTAAIPQAIGDNGGALTDTAVQLTVEVENGTQPEL